MNAGSPPATTPIRECADHARHPWVIACCHFGTAEMTLRDYRHESYRELYGREGVRYEVFAALGTDQVHSGPYWHPYVGNDYDAALSAFHEAENALLRGGDE